MTREKADLMTREKADLMTREKADLMTREKADLMTREKADIGGWLADRWNFGDYRGFCFLFLVFVLTAQMYLLKKIYKKFLFWNGRLEFGKRESGNSAGHRDSRQCVDV